MDKARLAAFVAQDKTILQISKELSTSYTNVRYWLRKHGLQTCRGRGRSVKKFGVQGLGDKHSGELQCRIHGLCAHALRPASPGKGPRWRCAKCEYAGVKRRRKKIKEKLVQLLGGVCERCSYSKCLRALSFHHRDRGAKEFSLSANSNLAWARLVTEVRKCALLCSNCHMEIEDGLATLGH